LINPAITDIERKEILDQVSVHLGNEANLHFFPDKVGNLAPYIYSKSLVNLMIPPRVLTTGIPMQAMEVMGSRGFLLCGYQADLANAFIPGEEVVLFDSRQDLLEKLTYFMEHGKERTSITKAALEKIRTEHTFARRLDILLQYG
ncbi:MAG: glycosyltransferase, partial [Lachnospiraceae bacterium]|nr:glycosyltransferase [Lachnospiraceae bacterium]